MRVLVTGGAGFVGSNVVKVLLEESCEVFILDDFSHADFKNLLGLDCNLIYGDVLDENIFKKLPHIDAVIHEAAITDTTLKDDRKMMAVNFGGFKNVLRYCIKKKVRLVYASSAGVYGDGSSPMKENQAPRPLNAYAYSKLLCDKEVVKISGSKDIPPLVGLRYFNVYGNGEDHKGKAASMIYQLYLQMKEDKSPRVFRFGEQSRDFVYIKDVAAATVTALSSNKSLIVNVGSGKAGAFNDIIAAINKALNKSLPADYFDNPYTDVYQNHTEADITNLKKTLGFIPHYSLQEGIKDYLNILINKPAQL